MDNHEKNTYAKKQMTKALLKLLENHSLDDITISMLTQQAGVSRMTFYRNYTDKTDILHQNLQKILDDWWEDFLISEDRSEEKFVGSLFEHFKNNKEFYRILFKNNLNYIILDRFVAIAGAKPEMTNSQAYFQSYFAYGLYGWVCEWVRRGMKEGANEMIQLIENIKQA